jgi:iron-sulfur cluster repair protein YtfE (RIC family)
MRTDLHRLATVAERIAGGERCSPRRAAALSRWVLALCTEIHDHHTAEDEHAWPVIARHAGAAVDLTELTDDHGALDPLLAGVRTDAAGLAGAGSTGSAAARLVTSLTALRDALDEHLDAEEETLFPVIERYVPAAEWARVDEAARASGPGIGFTLPRMVAICTPAERAEFARSGGPILGLLLALLAPAHRRRERLVMGALAR